MKKIIFIFGLIISCSVLYGQDNMLIYPKNVPNEEEKTMQILRIADDHVAVDWVGINLEKIPLFEQFTLQFGEQNLVVYKSRIEKRGINDFCFVGKDGDRCSIVMTVLDDDIQGIIHTIDGIYSIETFAKGEHAIVTIDQSKFKEDCPNIVGYYSITGLKLAQEPERGFYIVVYDNGKAERKMKQLK